MKLLLFIHSLSGGGAERITAYLANHWSRKGWAITVVTIAAKERGFYSLDPEINQISLDMEQASENLIMALRNNIRRVRSLRAILADETPDVALSMMTTSNCLLAIAAMGMPLLTVGSERIYPPSLPLGRVWSLMRRQSYRWLSAVVAQTKKSENWLLKNTRARKVVTIPNPVLFPLVSQEPELIPESFLGPDNLSNLILAVGRLTEQKGFDRLIDSFAKLNSRFPGWKLVILGEGEQRESLESKIRLLGLEGRVFLPGLVGNISDWYEIAEIYVLSSRYEGFPNSLVEAMAYGLPVVSVDCDTGPRELIRHEIDGLLVSQSNPDDLTDALQKLIGDADLRSRLSCRALDIRGRFSMENVESLWRDLFEGLSGHA